MWNRTIRRYMRIAATSMVFRTPSTKRLPWPLDQAPDPPKSETEQSQRITAVKLNEQTNGTFVIFIQGCHRAVETIEKLVFV